MSGYLAAASISPKPTLLAAGFIRKQFSQWGAERCQPRTFSLGERVFKPAGKRR
jgi:hypothetical protein